MKNFVYLSSRNFAQISNEEIDLLVESYLVSNPLFGIFLYSIHYFFFNSFFSKDFVDCTDSSEQK